MREERRERKEGKVSKKTRGLLRVIGRKYLREKHGEWSIVNTTSWGGDLGDTGRDVMMMMMMMICWDSDEISYGLSTRTVTR